MFFTGVAGTGKSCTLKAVIDALGGRNAAVAVTAPTGVSALNIEGQTIHSLAGCGVPNIAADFNKVRLGVANRLTRASTVS